MAAAIISEWGPWKEALGGSDLETLVLQAGWRRAVGTFPQLALLYGLGGQLGQLSIAPLWSYGELQRRIAWELGEAGGERTWTLTYGKARITRLSWPQVVFDFAPFPVPRPLLDGAPQVMVLWDSTCRAAVAFPG